MKFIRDFMDKIEPDKKDSPFLHTLWDGIDTFLYVPAHVTKNGTHIKDGMDLKRTMIHVVLAMQLAFMIGMYNIGHQHYFALGLYPEFFSGFFLKLAFGVLQYLPMLIVVHIVGLGIEFIFAAKKGHAIEEGFLVSGFLIPLIMPPATPLWIVALATAFSVVIAKEAFGGTGMNIFNVALIARVFVFFAFPGDISGDEVWIAHDYSALQQLFGMKNHTIELLAAQGVDYNALWSGPQIAWYEFWKDAPSFAANTSAIVDGWTGATPLSLAAKGGWADVQAYTVDIAGSTYHPYSTSNLIWGNVPGSVGEVSKIGVIIGALILVFTKIGSWRVMLSMILGAVFMAVLLNIVNNVYANELTNAFLSVPWYYHFAMGSFFFAMAFMATDPVTASSTSTGKWVYGFMIGVCGIIIRVLNPAYPEGWMLAILLLNVFAPLIDHVVLQQNIKRRVNRAKV